MEKDIFIHMHIYVKIHVHKIQLYETTHKQSELIKHVRMAVGAGSLCIKGNQFSKTA